MSWSPAQKAAIETYGKNILVAAAAGSGKTSVLVERIIRRLADEAQAFDVDSLLVVTFTNAAAAEMRERIGAALRRELERRPADDHLARQLARLHFASISTLHAFCQQIARQYFHLLDLDPQFRIANEAEIQLLQADVLEALFEERYAAGDAAFLEFVEHYGADDGDDDLYALVLRLYHFSRSHPWPAAWIAMLKERFDLTAEATLEDTPWPALLREQLALELEGCRDALRDTRARLAAAGGQPAYDAVLAEDARQVEAVLAASSWEALCGAANAVCFGRLPAVKGVDEAQKQAVKDCREQVKKVVNAFKDTFAARPAGEFMAELRQAAPLVETLGALVEAFGDAFSRAKQAKNIVDFSDLEHFCLRILLAQDSTPTAPRPSAAARALQEKYREILVDEYQDTNGVQELILLMLRRPDGANLFLVGDVKQSIYRFRLAEPELFLEKYRAYPDAGGRYGRIDLAQNFRSRAGVLDAVNFLFKQWMSPRVAELSYGPDEQLYAGPDYPAAACELLAGPVEVCLIDRTHSEPERAPAEDEEPAAETAVYEPAGFALEARWIARRLRALVDEAKHVYDKHQQTYRPLAWRDIAVLLRSLQGKADLLLDALRSENIPAYAEVETGYFNATEVQVILSLLRVIDNPRQDIPLAGVLRSPIVGLTVAELAGLRLAGERTDLWTAVAAAAARPGGAEDAPPAGKLRDFMARLASWRELARSRGVPELLWQLYRDTGYYDYVGGMKGGMLRQANLRALYERAAQYETTHFRGLFRFLRFVERMREQGTDLAVARTLSENEDVVRIMSIHKSKGLEFPLVVLADLGKAFNLSDSKELLLCHKKLGVGPYVTDPKLRLRYPTLARYAIAHKLNMETKAEELRVLYVALTRAREQLILVGSLPKAAPRLAAWNRQAARPDALLPDALIAGANSYLDWLGPALVRHPDGGPLRGDGCDAARHDDPSRWRMILTGRGDLAAADAPPPNRRARLDAVRRLAPVDVAADAVDVGAVLGWRYPQAAAVGKPAKLAVSEIKRRFDLLNAGEAAVLEPPPASRPLFLQQTGSMTGAEYGTLLHTVMQHLDLDGDCSRAGLRVQLERLTADEILLSQHAGLVDLECIEAFLTGDLGRRLLASADRRRELPFSLMLEAGRFYPGAPPGEQIFVQGIIDALFAEADGWVLIDYKTDRVADIRSLLSRYAIQLRLYAEAVRTILKQPVKEIFLYSFATGEAAAVPEPR